MRYKYITKIRIMFDKKKRQQRVSVTFFYFFQPKQVSNSRAFDFDPAFWVKLADPVLEAYLKEEIGFDVVQEHMKLEEQKWIRKAKRYILYDDAPYRMK